MDEDEVVAEPETTDELDEGDAEAELETEDGEQDPEPEAEVPAEEAEPEAPVRALSFDASESAEEREFREALGDPAMAAKLFAAMDRRNARAMQAMGAAQMQASVAAAEHPEFFRVYGAVVQSNLAQMPHAARAEPGAVNVAMAGVILEEANKVGMAAAIKKIGAMMGAVPTAAAAPKAPKAPIPAAQRPPSPGSGAGGGQLSGKESRIKFLMSSMELTRGEAEAAFAELSSSGGGQR